MDVHEFILKHIDTVPHLEAIVLLWNSRPVAWTREELASRLYIPTAEVSALLGDLVRLQWIAPVPASPSKYAYFSRSAFQDDMMRRIDDIYRLDLIRISTMIHSKKSDQVRDFARAFRFKKETE